MMMMYVCVCVCVCVCVSNLFALSMSWFQRNFVIPNISWTHADWLSSKDLYLATLLGIDVKHNPEKMLMLWF
jgi:hypothetical protein